MHRRRKPPAKRFEDWLKKSARLLKINLRRRLSEIRSVLNLNLSLFGTYRPQPALGQTGIKIGIEHLGPPVCLNLVMMLRFLFVTQLGRYAVAHNREYCLY